MLVFLILLYTNTTDYQMHYLQYIILFLDVRYYWVRESFPNLVQEDRRVFVSYDGYLYFSALEEIDAGNYSCNVQSKVSNTGKNGPLFELHVVMHCKFYFN